MGKTQKIPYINEVIFYFIKVIILFIIMDYFLDYLGGSNLTLILTFAVFSALSFQLFYFLVIFLNYFLFYYALLNVTDGFFILFLYLLSVLFNTFIVIVYLKIKYHFKEEA